ncbi:hypothetical protein, partial [Solemya velum gill symbiont]|uniref:hypothetical protein n=1 Tax=Solemya velum gill symbiont TaxID=2340 RepID=UPI001C4DEA14
VNESCFMDMSVDCCLTLIMSILCFDGNKSEFPLVHNLVIIHKNPDKAGRNSRFSTEITPLRVNTRISRVYDFGCDGGFELVSRGDDRPGRNRSIRFPAFLPYKDVQMPWAQDAQERPPSLAVRAGLLQSYLTL